MKFFDVCGVKVSVINIPEACRVIEGWIREKKQAYVCVAPVSTIVDCQADRKYRHIVNQADMVTPDGMPLVWLGKLAGYKEIDRTYGPDLMPAVCALSEQKGFRHFIYGGTEQSCEKLKQVLNQRFPKLQIVGHFAPDFHSTFVPEKKEIIDQINKSQADILWVGLGSPKQDYWMDYHRQLLNVPVILGVGAAFDFISGVKKQAPRWMQRSGLEWFFRLCSEPKRLWRRYLIGNTKFVGYVFADCIKKSFKKS